MGTNGPQEPPADMRVMAAMFRGMYLAMVEEGFSRREAMDMLSTVLAEVIRGAQNGGQ